MSAYLSVEEIGSKLNLDPATIRRYITIKMLAAEKQGTRWMIAVSEYERFISENTIPLPAGRPKGSKKKPNADGEMPSPKVPDGFVTVSYISNDLEVNPATVIRYISDNTLEASKFGRMYLVNKDHYEMVKASGVIPKSIGRPCKSGIDWKNPDERKEYYQKLRNQRDPEELRQYWRNKQRESREKKRSQISNQAASASSPDIVESERYDLMS